MERVRELAILILEQSARVPGRTISGRWFNGSNGRDMLKEDAQSRHREAGKPTYGGPCHGCRIVHVCYGCFPTRLLRPMGSALPYYPKQGLPQQDREGASGLKEAQDTGTAICTRLLSTSELCRNDSVVAQTTNELVLRQGEGDYYGVIRAEPGSHICRAFFVANDWAQSGDTTFTTTIIRDVWNNGLGWYVSIPRGTDGADFVDLRVIIEQVPAGSREGVECWPTGSHPWQCRGADCEMMPGAKFSIPEPFKKCIDYSEK